MNLTNQLFRLTPEDVIVEEAQNMTTKCVLGQRSREMAPARIVLTVGSRSPWISQLLRAASPEVILANPHKLQLICENNQKSDRVDVEYLVREGPVAPKLLVPIRHLGPDTQADLAILRSRDALMRFRPSRTNRARGAGMAVGGRLPSCGTPNIRPEGSEAKGEIQKELEAVLLLVVDTIGGLSEQITDYDRLAREISEVNYPETALLRQVPKVGAITALSYVLIPEDLGRFDQLVRRCLPGAGAPEARVRRGQPAAPNDQGRRPGAATPARPNRSLHPRACGLNTDPQRQGKKIAEQRDGKNRRSKPASL